MPNWHGFSVVVAVWLVYLAVKVAEHVHAWPF